MTTTKERDAIEQIVDATSLQHVLEALADICYMKAEHVAQNWQDQGLARLWKLASDAIDRVGGSVTIKRVS